MIKFYAEGPQELVELRARINRSVDQLNLLKTKFSDLHLTGQWEAARKVDEAIQGIEESIRSAHLVYTGTDLDAKVSAFCKNNGLDPQNYQNYRKAVIAISKEG